MTIPALTNTRKNPHKTCQLCGGTLAYLGTLGKLSWWQCVNCGMDFSSKKVSKKIRKNPYLYWKTDKQGNILFKKDKGKWQTVLAEKEEEIPPGVLRKLIAMEKKEPVKIYIPEKKNQSHIPNFIPGGIIPENIEEIRWQIIYLAQQNKDKRKASELVGLSPLNKEPLNLSPSFVMQMERDCKAGYKFYDALGMWLGQYHLWSPETQKALIETAKWYLEHIPTKKNPCKNPLNKSEIKQLFTQAKDCLQIARDWEKRQNYIMALSIISMGIGFLSSIRDIAGHTIEKPVFKEFEEEYFKLSEELTKKRDYLKKILQKKIPPKPVIPTGMTKEGFYYNPRENPLTESEVEDETKRLKQGFSSINYKKTVLDVFTELSQLIKLSDFVWFYGADAIDKNPKLQQRLMNISERIYNHYLYVEGQITGKKIKGYSIPTSVLPTGEFVYNPEEE
jgi:hypothetical protein